MTTQTNIVARPYSVTPTSIEESTFTNGKGVVQPIIRMRANVKVRGKDLTRTVTAKGKAADAIRSVVSVGTTSVLRMVSDKFEGTDGRSAMSFAVLGVQPPRKPKAVA